MLAKGDIRIFQRSTKHDPRFRIEYFDSGQNFIPFEVHL